ncbi:unnamed protein product [Rhizophagus irregularis]|uniref:Uncharacterized protein n=2 Tax=Rhizophagus irregularis TaxID=588596 RepID=A0A915YW61_9GLOM|nr:unnamed protein product [Rhizophagus irregularis]CAB5346979.1 unnamed protein product [Rhizophagus irregularis]
MTLKLNTRYKSSFVGRELKKFNIYVRLVKGEVIAYKMPSPVHALLAARLSYMLQSWSNQLFVYSELDITAGNNKTPAPENEEVGTGEGLEASVMQYLTC